jgi:hydrogenase maturation factor
MCVQRPMRVVRVDSPDLLIAEAGGRLQPVSAAVLAADGTPVGPGDWLLVLGGVAVEVISPAEAERVGRMASRVLDGPAADEER